MAHNIDPATLATLQAAHTAREAAMLAQHAAACPSWAALQAAKAAYAIAIADPNVTMQAKGSARAAVQNLTVTCHREFKGLPAIED